MRMLFLRLVLVGWQVLRGVRVSEGKRVLHGMCVFMGRDVLHGMRVLILAVVCGLISMQVVHIVVMVVLLENYIEVAGTNAGLQYIFYFDCIAGHWKTVKCLDKFFLISAQIEKGCHCHVTADSRHCSTLLFENFDKVHFIVTQKGKSVQVNKGKQQMDGKSGRKLREYFS